MSIWSVDMWGYIGLVFYMVLSVLVWEWHARMVFVARCYPRKHGHGKSWKRAHQHYKSSWSLIQRLLWIPLFKEEYISDYRWMAYLSYFQFSVMILSAFITIIDAIAFSDVNFYQYAVVIYSIIVLLRFIHTNAIARGRI